MASRPLCETPGCDEHYACRLRNKGLNVSPRVTMTRTQNWRPTPSVPSAHNAKPVMTDRGNGVTAPVFKPDGELLRHGEYKHDRKKWDREIQRTREQATMAATSKE